MSGIKEKDIRINGDIRAEQVRLLGPENEQFGVMTAREALFVGLRYSVKYGI